MDPDQYGGSFLHTDSFGPPDRAVSHAARAVDPACSVSL